MSTRSTTILMSAVVVWLGGVAARADEPQPPAGIEIQARGPVHEAFADPALANPEPGPVAPKKPPEAVPEIPPDQKPEGDNIQWIPGYWSWDEDRTDFLWISGVWRKTPPGQRWVPGYWSEADNGWQWARGFWAPEDRQELPYQPAPPAALDNGPSAAAPNDDSVYVPGAWRYQANRYAWQPGRGQTAGRLRLDTDALCVDAARLCLPAGLLGLRARRPRSAVRAVAFTQPLWNDPAGRISRATASIRWGCWRRCSCAPPGAATTTAITMRRRT